MEMALRCVDSWVMRVQLKIHCSASARDYTQAGIQLQHSPSPRSLACAGSLAVLSLCGKGVRRNDGCGVARGGERRVWPHRARHQRPDGAGAWHHQDKCSHGQSGVQSCAKGGGGRGRTRRERER